MLTSDYPLPLGLLLLAVLQFLLANPVDSQHQRLNAGEPSTHVHSVLQLSNVCQPLCWTRTLINTNLATINGGALAAIDRKTDHLHTSFENRYSRNSVLGADQGKSLSSVGLRIVRKIMRCSGVEGFGSA